MDQHDQAKEATELPLKFEDIVDKKTYDKMRPPKPGGSPEDFDNFFRRVNPCFVSGSATRVQFHVTVMSLDSIDEGSMVI